jgi:hypothetical protein
LVDRNLPPLAVLRHIEKEEAVPKVDVLLPFEGENLLLSQPGVEYMKISIDIDSVYG